MIDRITYGRLNVMCAIRMVANPIFPILRIPKVPTNRSMSEIPVTISGFIIGMLVTPEIAFFT